VSGPRSAAGWERWVPGLLVAATYRREWLTKDLVAGLVLTTLLVPQGMAYAELAGLPPITGLYTTVLCLLGYAVFGPSRVLVLGPDSSLGPMIAAVIIPIVGSGGDPAVAVGLASMLALMVGLFMTVAGIAKLGFLADLLSKPTQIGYMNGLALTIVVSQLPKLCGFSVDASGLISEAAAFARGLAAGEVVPAALGIGLFTLAVIMVLQRWLPKLPAVLIGVVAAISATWMLDLGRRGVKLVGPLPSGLPPLTLPHASWSQIVLLLVGALGITLVSLTDTISTASSFAARSGQQVRGNQEMIGIGAANLASSLFQGFPVSTSGSRTAVAAQSGARSQLTGVVGAAVIVLMLLLVPGLLRDLPQPALGAVVIAASLSLADIPGTRQLWRRRRMEFFVSITAFLGVALLGVLPGIAVAVGISVLNVFRRLWWPYQAVLGRVRGLQAARSGAVPLRRAADLRQRPGLPQSATPARRHRSGAAMDRDRGRTHHGHRHHRGGHARGSGRGTERAWHRAGPGRAQGPGAAQDRPLPADPHDRPRALLPDDRGCRGGVPGGDRRRMDGPGGDRPEGRRRRRQPVIGHRTAPSPGPAGRPPAAAQRARVQLCRPAQVRR
jgi:high affinity sulfate transporter 1